MSRLQVGLRHLSLSHLVLAVGCSAPDTPISSNAVVIHIPDPVPDIHLASELHVGGYGSSTYFFNIQDVVADDSGFIYISDRSEEAIRVFNQDGELVRRIGRKGQGPGEFSTPMQISVANDTLVVQDSGGLLHLFDLGGEHLNSLNVGGALATAMKIQTAPGKLVLVGMGDSADARWTISMTKMFVRTLDYQTGVVSSPIWALPLSEMHDIGFGGKAPDVGAPYPSIAPTVQGSIYGSGWDGYTIELRSSDGTLRERANAVAPKVRVSDLDIRLAEKRIAAIPGAKLPRGRKYRAPLGELLADASGNLLIERADLRQDTMRVWDVVKTGWTVVGRIRTPPSFRLLYFSQCRLYGTTQDETGVEMIVTQHAEPCPLL